MAVTALPMETYYPRVLMISRTEIDPFSSQGAARGGWFRTWPKDCLAHMFSSKGRAEDPFCGHNYVLTDKERSLGWAFRVLKAAALGESSGPALNNGAETRPIRKSKLSLLARRWGTSLLIDTGLWELLFPPKLSPELTAWVSNFRPEVIYAAATDLSYVRFALLVHKRFGLPICLHIDDDWPNTLYRNSIFGFLMFRIVKRTFRSIASEASICLTIGDAMAREYQRRYQVKTEPIMCVDEPERFAAVQPDRTQTDGEVTIAYVGGLHLNRWQSLIDLCESVDDLRRRGERVGLSIYALPTTAEARAAFGRFPWVRFLPPPPHEEVPSVLKAAQLLFLTEAFSEEYLDYIRFSISSKSQVYMMSDRPVLAYGPDRAGVIEYAAAEGWAYVVDTPDRNRLQDAISRLLTDEKLRTQLVRRAAVVAAKNHNAVKVRERLRKILMESAAPQDLAHDRQIL